MKFGLFLFALCSASMLSGASAQMEGHRVGDEICVEGYVMDDFCIQRETLLDRSDVETLVSPFLHSTYCLVDVPPCYNSPYNILMDPEEKGEKYKIGYYVSDNKQIIDFTMGVRSDNPVGLRLVVTGLVENSKTNEKGVLQHFMMTTEVKVAEEGMMGCPEMTKEVTETMAPSMMDSMNGTYMGTMMDSMKATMM